ncbi:MAG: hypothetical protein KIS30_03030 [Thermoplasmata archaeon]|nr:hypothetical protein [Candidatus Sysuiplasma acidicola]MBX8637370.1 hypothetical protein [Candidatus Sysuiplasma acidicola]MBX8645717.1 hypothetical protein [Candidatus Sysuiplasma acidicola]MDH2906291.1 hypothetical protein [Methanomassiliicoccales archaeon]
MIRVRVIARIGDPFFTGGRTEGIPSEHLELLNSLFFEGEVDKGGIVEIEGSRYVCTMSGWSAVEE